MIRFPPLSQDTKRQAVKTLLKVFGGLPNKKLKYEIEFHYVRNTNNETRVERNRSTFIAMGILHTTTIIRINDIIKSLIHELSI